MTQRTIAPTPTTIGCGIYRIRCLVNDRTYIGKTARAFIKRWDEHRDDCNGQRHANYKLQYDWLLYGEDAFKFEVVELCGYEELSERERFWILQEKPYYNIDLPAEEEPKGKQSATASPNHWANVGAIIGAFIAYYLLFMR